MSTKTKTNYEEMFPDEFKQAIKNKPLAFLPLGSMEYHGYHNTLGLDALKAWKICQLAAKRVGGIVFPPLYLGVDAWPDIDLQKYPNKQFDCYHIDSKLYQEILAQYFYRMLRIGFKQIFVLAGHYPNADVAKLASEKFADQGLKIIVVKEPDLVKGEAGDHAGKWETSLLMVLFPELVDLKLMEKRDNRLMAIEGIDPNESSEEYGNEILQKILYGIEKIVNRQTI